MGGAVPRKRRPYPPCSPSSSAPWREAGRRPSEPSRDRRTPARAPARRPWVALGQNVEEVWTVGLRDHRRRLTTDHRDVVVGREVPDAVVARHECASGAQRPGKIRRGRTSGERRRGVLVLRPARPRTRDDAGRGNRLSGCHPAQAGDDGYKSEQTDAHAALPPDAHAATHQSTEPSRHLAQGTRGTAGEFCLAVVGNRDFVGGIVSEAGRAASN